MSKFTVLVSLMLPAFSWAIDCSKVKPFVPTGHQAAQISIAHFFWDNSSGTEVQSEENLCSLQTTVYSYDIRGRENEAYWCLKPKSEEVVSCPLAFDGIPSQVVVIPSIWIHTVNGVDLRGYQFHSYIFKQSDQSMFLHDVYSRSQVTNLSTARVSLDAGYQNGTPGYRDGYFVNASFH